MTVPEETTANATGRETTVLVVGGGPAGLSMAALLGRFAIDCMLIERRSAVNPHPRARSINVRTAEIFRQWGILEDLRRVSLPPEWSSQFVYTQTLAGREIGRTELNVQPFVDGVELSPAPWLLSSQDRIEPIIADYAASLDSVELCWGWRLTDIEHDPAGGVTVVAADAAGVERTITTDWLVAADGAASSVREALGVAMEGPTGLATLVNCHFHADLDRWTLDRPAALYWTTAPARNVFQKIDTEHRWLCQIGYDPREHRPEDFDRDTAANWIRRSIGDPGTDPGVAELELDVHDVIPWVMSSTVAERLQVGRVFLIGDAAHQLPPSGGFGMNTAVQDAHNLAWKLAHVVRGREPVTLLGSYDTERRPVARYNADRSLDNTRAVGRIRKLVETAGERQSESEREAIAASGRYGNWLGMDLGVHYTEGWFTPDGTGSPTLADPVSDYAPCAVPGHRAPHVALDPAEWDGATSTLDLFDRDPVCLLGPEAVTTTRPGLIQWTLDVARDPEGAVAEAYGIGSTGWVVVRPDGHVAERHATDERTDEPEVAGPPPGR